MQQTTSNKTKIQLSTFQWALIGAGGTFVACLLCVALVALNTVAPIAASIMAPTKTPAPIASSFANQEMSIAVKQNNKAVLNFPRYMGVDQNGNIHVGNAGDGSVNTFGPSGNLLNSIPVLAKGSSLYGMAVAPDGTVYLSADGKIQRIDMQGKDSSLPYDASSVGGSELRDIALSPDGSLLALDDAGNVLRFEKDGNPKLLVHNPFETYLKHTESWSTFAVDTSGDIYVLGESTCMILKLDPDGKLISQFGGETHNHVYRGINDPPGGFPMMDPGFFYEPVAIAVDHSGRVYISDKTYNVQVFDANEKYLASFGVPDIVMWMSFDAGNAMYISSDAPAVIKLALKNP